MAKASISLRSLNDILNRVETKLQTLEAQFTDLDSSLQNLAQKFELQAKMLEKQMSQDGPWTWAPAEGLGSEEERESGRRERPLSRGRGGRAAPRRRPLREAAALPAGGPEGSCAPAAELQLGGC
ncbi:single-pass membrane and coiled-coil domain-containing protein 1 [Haliaeetus albicilla]|uniref:single-pass membrane and coiled-coil domain-containing protein 1 n=1 Tax=Haliaeetus albicilla TaxID=8969 RepID=UPI0037E76A52